MDKELVLHAYTKPHWVSSRAERVEPEWLSCPGSVCFGSIFRLGYLCMESEYGMIHAPARHSRESRRDLCMRLRCDHTDNGECHGRAYLVN